MLAERVDSEHAVQLTIVAALLPNSCPPWAPTPSRFGRAVYDPGANDVGVTGPRDRTASSDRVCATR